MENSVLDSIKPLKEVINEIDFEEVKTKPVIIKILNSCWLKSIKIEYDEATTIYDKTGYTYCLKTKYMPFNRYPMRDNNYIQTYKSVKRMLNSLYKQVMSTAIAYKEV